MYNPWIPNVYEDEAEMDDIFVECGVGGTKRKFKRRCELIKIRGGKCEKCGYDKAISALDFHHPNPKTKEFTLGFVLCNFTNKQYQEIVIPHIVNYTILLCSNCHRETHWGKKEISDFLK